MWVCCVRTERCWLNQVHFVWNVGLRVVQQYFGLETEVNHKQVQRGIPYLQYVRGRCTASIKNTSPRDSNQLFWYQLFKIWQKGNSTRIKDRESYRQKTWRKKWKLLLFLMKKSNSKLIITLIEYHIPNLTSSNRSKKKQYKKPKTRKLSCLSKRKDLRTSSSTEQRKLGMRLKMWRVRMQIRSKTYW